MGRECDLLIAFLRYFTVIERTFALFVVDL